MGKNQSLERERENVDFVWIQICPILFGRKKMKLKGGGGGADGPWQISTFRTHLLLSSLSLSTFFLKVFLFSHSYYSPLHYSLSPKFGDCHLVKRVSAFLIWRSLIWYVILNYIYPNLDFLCFPFCLLCWLLLFVSCIYLSDGCTFVDLEGREGARS